MYRVSTYVYLHRVLNFLNFIFGWTFLNFYERYSECFELHNGHEPGRRLKNVKVEHLL